MADCLFCNIASGRTGTDFLYEDGEVVAFRDISPQAPFHALIVPREHIESAAALGEAEGPMLGRIFALAARLAEEAGCAGGYRVVSNVGPEGGQSVPHLHFHVLAGRQLGWPPG
jgi:histidine triad (HIT) family protein